VVARSENRLFFPQSALDEWIVDGSVELNDGILSILSESRRFRLTEAVRVLAEVSGSGDARELDGRARERAELESLGAEILESSMLLGDAAYDIVPGWLGAPVEPPSVRPVRDARAEPELETEEEVLLRFLAKNA
jgi:hypothetical protein